MPDHFYIYPAYLGRGGSRGEGRRIPAALALPDLTGEEILAAVQALGYKAEVEAEKHYPRAAAQFAGRVKVTKRGKETKAVFLRTLATELQRRRGSGAKK
ncbi:MAG: signal recognition particle subunit SRP19/SEC65 family protein [Thermoplasmata archaeon]